jgi:hypothetical protein
MSIKAMKQEPVAWVDVKDSYEGPYEFHGINRMEVGKHHLYTAPPQREWVELTAKDIIDAYISVSGKEWAIGGLEDASPFARSIEAKLKEKNT